MKQDTTETAVVFRVWRDTGDVIALMPYLVASVSGYEVTSYMHVGQHGPADFQTVMDRTRPAQPEEFAALKRELESIGYKVRWITRANYWKMTEARREQLRGTHA